MKSSKRKTTQNTKSSTHNLPSVINAFSGKLEPMKVISGVALKKGQVLLRATLKGPDNILYENFMKVSLENLEIGSLAFARSTQRKARALWSMKGDEGITALGVGSVGIRLTS